MLRYLFLLLVLAACTGAPHERENKKHEDQKDSTEANPEEKDSSIVHANDTLNTIAGLIAGNVKQSVILNSVLINEDYISFSDNFSKRWHAFDSTRVSRLSNFQRKELSIKVPAEPTLFYPFSGPDILHAVLFFPNVEKYVLFGLEPIGTIPTFNTDTIDMLEPYYSRLNNSLNAILNFSFFRTESMDTDLSNDEVDGTVHLLFLFLNRTGNMIITAKPVTVDSLGALVYLPSFSSLKVAKLKTKGVEIRFITPDNQVKDLLYFSANAADYALQHNAGFSNYLNHLQHFNVYLKGASYLLHKSVFSQIRNVVLNGATTVIQDDSGIAVKYFFRDTNQWTFHLYGQYTQPIKMFAMLHQPALDSLYKKQGSTALDFGIGYNYRDKNSNFMVITKKN